MPVAEGLRRRGWDVTTAVEEETLGYTDGEHIEFALQKGWVILTFDDDFLSLVGSGYEENYPAIIYVSQHGRDVGDLVKRIDLVLEKREIQNISSEIVYA